VKEASGLSVLRLLICGFPVDVERGGWRKQFRTLADSRPWIVVFEPRCTGRQLIELPVQLRESLTVGEIENPDRSHVR
jgi:hypothetical protein